MQRLEKPIVLRSGPVVSSTDLCTAAQRTLVIKDRYGALSFLEKHRCKPTDVLSKVGLNRLFFGRLKNPRSFYRFCRCLSRLSVRFK